MEVSCHEVWILTADEQIVEIITEVLQLYPGGQNKEQRQRPNKNKIGGEFKKRKTAVTFKQDHATFSAGGYFYFFTYCLVLMVKLPCWV